MTDFEDNDNEFYDEDELDESDDSVADGLGLYIDDDGNWIPKDDDDFLLIY